MKQVNMEFIGFNCLDQSKVLRCVYSRLFFSFFVNSILLYDRIKVTRNMRSNIMEDYEVKVEERVKENKKYLEILKNH